ncbi:MAG: DUF4350 domain-containing protein [Desulfosalsimonas sp.]
MKMNQPVVKNAVILFIVAAVMLAGFFLLFEKTERKVPTPGSEQARKNPFLAAERFLNECGITAESTDQRQILINLPPANDLIFINRLGGNLPSKRENRLIEWIGKGGTLVITHDRLWREKFQKSGNNLLDRLEVRQFDARKKATGDSSGQEEENNEAENAGNPCVTQDRELVRVPAGKDTFAEVRFIPHYILEDASDAESKSYGGKTGTHIIDREIGRGRLIVLSDNEFLKNSNIQKKDHAFYFAGLSPEQGKVWIQYKSRMPSFFSILWGKAPLFFISLLVFAVFFILWLTIRIGPRQTPVDHSSRNITEHLLAAGRFTWRHDPDRLINDTRAGIEKKMTARYRFRNRKTREQSYDALARWTELPRDDVIFALTADIDRPAAFVRATAILQEINSALTIKKKRGLF